MADTESVEEQEVTPWIVRGSEKGINYSKLIGTVL